MPDSSSMYDILLKSVISLPKIYDYCLQQEYKRRPDINDCLASRDEDDLGILQNTLLEAARLFYGNGELLHRDMRERRGRGRDVPYPSIGPRRSRYYRGGYQQYYSHTYRGGGGRGGRDRNGRDRNGRGGHRQSGNGDSGKECYACGGPHIIKNCHNKRKQKQWVIDNDACWNCFRRGHKKSECSLLKGSDRGRGRGGYRGRGSRSRGRGGYRGRGRRQYRGNNDRGGYGRDRYGRGGYDRGGYKRGGRGGNGLHNRVHNTVRKQYILHYVHCQNIIQDGYCEYGDNCRYVHPSDFHNSDKTDIDNKTPSQTPYKRDTIPNNDEEKNDSHRHLVQQQLIRNKINQKKWMNVQKDKGITQQQFLQSNLLFYNKNYYGFDPKDVPKEDQGTISIGNKYKESIHDYNILIDSGSSLSTITEQTKDLLIKETDWDIIPGNNPFLVENGGKIDEQFSGDHILVPVRIIGTNSFYKLKLYIMPHNNCNFPMILGLSDMKMIGYDIGARYGDHTVLFRNRGNRPKVKTIKKSDDILNNIRDYGDEFTGYQIVQQRSDRSDAENSNFEESGIDWGDDLGTDDESDDEDGRTSSSDSS